MKLFKTLIIILVFFFALVHIISLLAVFYQPKIEETQPSSNQKIIEVYTEGLKKDSVFLNQVAEAYIETKYRGVILYNCHSRGRLHTLGDINAHVDLTDRYSKIRDVIKGKFPNARDTWYDYYYNDGIFFLHVLTFRLFNQKTERVLLLYTYDLEKLKQRFSNYKFYDTNNIPIDTYGWIYRISKNWYICSPDDDLYFQEFNDFSKTINTNEN